MKQRLDQPTASVQLLDYYSSENLSIPCRKFKTNNHFTFNVYYGIEKEWRSHKTRRLVFFCHIPRSQDSGF